MIDFSIAASTNVKNHVIHHHPRQISALVLPPKSLIVHVEKAPLLQTPLSINISTHSHLGITVPPPSHRVIPSAPNLTLPVLIHAKPNATSAPVPHVQLR